jgi:hypothetical protein
VRNRPDFFCRTPFALYKPHGLHSKHVASLKSIASTLVSFGQDAKKNNKWPGKLKQLVPRREKTETLKYDIGLQVDVCGDYRVTISPDSIHYQGDLPVFGVLSFSTPISDIVVC